MIRYQLICEKDHGFEAWFADSAAFDRQKKANQLACPDCGSSRIEKALMAPGIAKAGADAPAKRGVFQADTKAAEINAAMRKLREHVTANADYVGDRFADEARKIHYDEAEARGIYGETSADEAAALKEEGIEFHPLPVLPEDQN